MTVLNRRNFENDQQYLFERHRQENLTWDHLNRVLTSFLQSVFRRICSLPNFVQFQRLCFIFDREFHLIFDDFYNGEGVFANIDLDPFYDD